MFLFRSDKFLDILVRDFLYIDEDVSQDGNDVELSIVVVQTNVKVIDDNLSEFVPDEDLLQIKYLFYDIGLQKDQTVPQVKLMDLEFHVRKVLFEALLVGVLLVFFNFDDDFFKKNFHVIKESIDHVFDVSTVDFFFPCGHSFRVLGHLLFNFYLII